MLETCHHRGHCFHRLDDGTIFVRHSQLPMGKTECVCCWCEKHAFIEQFSRRTAPPAPSSFILRDHGPFVPPPSVQPGVPS